MIHEAEIARIPGMHIIRLRPRPDRRRSTGKPSESEERFLREQSDTVERIIKRREERLRESKSPTGIKERARAKTRRNKTRKQKRKENKKHDNPLPRWGKGGALWRRLNSKKNRARGRGSRGGTVSVRPYYADRGPALRGH
jgi:hypothetical protein